MLYPNQRAITIHRETVKNAKEPFLAVSNSNLFYAMNNLTNSAFKVYVYFLANKDKYQMGISPADIKNKTGVCIETARKAIKELELRKYIFLEEDFRYHFYERPYLREKVIQEKWD